MYQTVVSLYTTARPPKGQARSLGPGPGPLHIDVFSHNNVPVQVNIVLASTRALVPVRYVCAKPQALVYALVHFDAERPCKGRLGVLCPVLYPSMHIYPIGSVKTGF